VTASRASSARRAPLLALLALATAVLLPSACRTRTPVPGEDLLEPLAARPAITPSESDIAAARVAEAALAAGPDPSPARRSLLEALARLKQADDRERALGEQMDADLRRRESPRRPVGPGERAAARRDRWERREVHVSRLWPLARDAANATLDDARAYREASKELLAEEDVDPAQQERLEREIHDDPLELARDRERDDFTRKFALTFNAVAEPLGKSVMTGFGLVMAPYEIATTAVHWLMSMLEGDSLSTQERQALAQRKRFLRAYPDAPESASVRGAVERDQRELQELFARRYDDFAARALANGQPRLAAASAKRALMQKPGDERATVILSAAQTRVDQLVADGFRSRSASPTPPRDLVLDPERTHGTLVALWQDDPGELLSSVRAFQAAHRHDALQDESLFLLALVQEEAGYEEASWDGLRDLSSRNPRSSNMARHAAALVSDPLQNPWDAFERAKRHGLQEAVSHEVFGQWSEGPRYKSVPTVIGYLADLPSIVRTAILTPIRALLGTFQGRPDFQKDTAVAAYRYLGRHPDGEHSEEVYAWLIDYEAGRGNYDAALRLADFRPGFDSETRQEWVEEAAEARLAMAAKIQRRDERGTVLRSIVMEYPDSEAGHHAGMEARNQVIEASAQRIRMTRGFLEENPKIAGLEGIGLRPELLDGDVRNGELHPEGIAFLGGRQMEFALIDETGDEDHAPVLVRQMVSPERLSRTVALLDETALRNARVDRDDEFAPDPRRDRYFERARLGLTEEVDPRPTAESTYVFRGMRERYGVVRGRDSVLPFDLVFQGSLQDLSLGAFPRWHQPRETPDAFLYR